MAATLSWASPMIKEFLLFSPSFCLATHYARNKSRTEGFFSLIVIHQTSETFHGFDTNEILDFKHLDFKMHNLQEKKVSLLFEKKHFVK